MAGQFINAPSPSRREARNFENELDIVIVGNKSDKNVTSGQYVTVRDSSITGITNGIYKATANVAAGTAFVAANLSAVTSGALNDLSGNLATKTATITGNGSWSFNNPVKKVADIVTFIGYATNTSALQINSWTVLGTLPEGYRPSETGCYVPGYDNTNDSAVIVRIASNGVVDVYSKTAAKTIAFNFTFCV